MKIKNLILTLSSAVVTVVPIVSVIACSEKGPIQLNKNTLSSKVQVEEDGLYIIKDGFNNFEGFKNGKIFDENGKEANFTRIKMDKYGSNWMDGVSQVGTGDAIYFLYDNDDNDGINPSNFEDTFFFDDTSIMISPEVKKLNEELGVIRGTGGPFAPSLIPFKDNQISQYFGSQNNHMSGTWEDKMAVLEARYGDTREALVADIKKYYDSASKGFFPSFAPDEGFIKYEKIERGVKLTFDIPDDFASTAAKFVFKYQDPETNEIVQKISAPFSIGKENEWNAYNKDGYKFAAKKEIAQLV